MMQPGIHAHAAKHMDTCLGKEVGAAHTHMVSLPELFCQSVLTPKSSLISKCSFPSQPDAGQQRFSVHQRHAAVHAELVVPALGAEEPLVILRVLKHGVLGVVAEGVQPATLLRRHEVLVPVDLGPEAGSGKTVRC